MNPTSTAPKESHPFHLQLARDCGWPLVTRDGRKAEVLKWDAKHDECPLIGWREYSDAQRMSSWSNQGEWVPENESEEDLMLSADYSDPRVRAAVQAAHEKLGMEVAYAYVGANFNPEATLSSKFSPPQWQWGKCDYRLAIHLPAPADPIAPGHNPDRLTVSQVGDGWRLLDEDEIKERSRERTPRGTIESWEGSEWFAGRVFYAGSDKAYTYRTRLSREDLAKLDRPATTAPKLVPYDFETGPLMLKVRHKTSGHLARACIAPNGFTLATFLPHDIRAVSFEALLKDYVRLNGKPCGKLVQ